jgi:hypothetical protein
MVKVTIIAAAVAAALIATTTITSAATSAATTADEEALARSNWRALLAKNPAPAQGCFHASYPSLDWESVACKATQTRVHPVPVHLTAGGSQAVGNRNDYVLEAQGLIDFVYASLQPTGVTSEQTVGVAALGGGGILGANEYTLQLNTNAASTTHACAGGSSQCTVWQQFVYGTDWNTKGEAALFMEYWLLDWGSSSPCPKGWTTFQNFGQTDCFQNSSYTALPDIPPADLGDALLTASVTPGGNDVLTLDYGSDAYYVSASDSVLDISSVWTEAEFNVFGDGDDSEADFNAGSSILVQLMVADGTVADPLCVPGSGTTGETNNLTLGTCQAGLMANPSIGFTDPYIQFNEFRARPVGILPPAPVGPPVTVTAQ